MGIVGRFAAALGSALVAQALPASADSPDRPLDSAPRLVAAMNGKSLERRMVVTFRSHDERNAVNAEFEAFRRHFARSKAADASPSNRAPDGNPRLR